MIFILEHLWRHTWFGQCKYLEKETESNLAEQLKIKAAAVVKLASLKTHNHQEKEAEKERKQKDREKEGKGTLSW